MRAKVNKSEVTRIAFIDILDHPTVSFFQEYIKAFVDIGETTVIDLIALEDVNFDKLDEQGYDGIIVSGSVTPYCSRESWIVSLSAFIRRVYLADHIPLLGLCMVHELIAVLFGGLVLPGIRKELGLVKLQLSDAGKYSRFLDGLDESIHLLAAHGRDVIIAPVGAEILASNERTQCQIFRYGNLYGVQSHPELGADAIRYWLRTREGMKSLISQNYISHEDELESYLEESIQECEDRYRIFSNFVQLCKQKKFEQHTVQMPTKVGTVA